ncbi:MAG: DUF350 domain-containing protein [Acidimicrobiales bacterium]
MFAVEMSEFISETWRLIYSATAYAAAGLVVLVLGGILVDLLLPGKLRAQIWEEKHLNASVMLSTALLGITAIIVASIRAASDDVATGVFDTLIFGGLGFVLFALTFWVVDVLTPGKLGDILVDEEFHPAVIVSGTVNVAVGLIIAFAIY